MRLANQQPGEVLLVPYDPRWPGLYAAEVLGLRQAFGATLVALEHIGSTSVPGLAAKPIIDIQVLVQSVLAAREAVPALAALGWEQGVFAPDPEQHLYFKKNDADGIRTHQLHVYAPGHPAAHPHRQFRDYLRTYPEEARRYEDLKRELAVRFRTDRITYSDAKTDYVESVLAKAKEQGMDEIIVADYDPAWPSQFAEIAGRVRKAFADGPLIAVEHIGSTAVMGLAAKPIIDIDVIIPSHSDIPDAIARLATLGYTHQGDLGIPGREAFGSPPETANHHLYLCVCDNAEYCHHVAFRNYLREHSGESQRYEALKRDLAARFPNDRAAYSEGKTTFVAAVLKKAQH